MARPQRKSFSMVLDTATLEQQADNIGAAALSATRKAAQAGAQVLYDEVVLNVDRFVGVKTGNLRSSIYQVFSQDNSRASHVVAGGQIAYEKAVYHVSWNATKAPHGHLVEYGHVFRWKPYLGSDGKWYTSKIETGKTEKEAARPFLRPAWDTKRVAALQAMAATWSDEVKKAL